MMRIGTRAQTQMGFLIVERVLPVWKASQTSTHNILHIAILQQWMPFSRPTQSGEESLNYLLQKLLWINSLLLHSHRYYNTQALYSGGRRGTTRRGAYRPPYVLNYQLKPAAEFMKQFQGFPNYLPKTATYEDEPHERRAGDNFSVYIPVPPPTIYAQTQWVLPACLSKTKYQLPIKEFDIL